MATVYLAEDLKHYRQVAVKVLRPELSAAVAEKRFLQEIDIAAHLSHPNILALHDSGEGEGLVYYVMPYVDGGSLRDRLSAGVQIPVGEALRVVHALGDALAYAHSRALVHRDIKPENILFQADHPVVSDFGIARALAKAGASSVTQAGVAAGGSGNSLITDVGLAVGTPAYISPEQASGSEVDHRADIYALGIVAYELLSGSPPFIRNTSQQTIAAHVTDIPRPVSELRESVPPQVAALIMSCLEKDPARRPQSATEVMHILETVSGLELKSSARTDARLTAKGALVRALGIYALAFVAVGATAWSAMMGLGLPDWVFPGALLVMAAGLPAIFLTAWVHYSTHATPAYTPSRSNTGEKKTLAQRLLPFFTWQRMGWGTISVLVLFMLSVAGVMTTRALGIGPAATLITAGKLDPNDRFVVADFATHGADSSLGTTLASAARAALEQSAAVRVLSTSEVAEVLRRMEKPAATRVDLEVAREIAIREGIRAIVGGEVSGVGQRFLITVRLFEARSGATLAQESGVARGADDLIAMIDELSRKLRSRIGESLRSVRMTPPLAQVTTASLEALEKHTAGTKALVEGDPDKAVQLLREAITIDTGFAMSWRALAAAMANAGIRGAARDSALRAAFRHKDRATPLERDLIAAFYYWNVERDREKAATAYEAVAQRDSGSPQLINLQQIYWSRRDFARAEQLARDILRRKPETTIALINLIEALCDQGRYREADSVIAAAGTKGSQPGLVQWRARLLYYENRLDDYGRVLDSLAESSLLAVKRFAVPARAGYSLLGGRVRTAIDQRATARRNGWAGATEPPAVDVIFAARANGEILGRRDVSKRQLDSLMQQLIRSPVDGGLRAIAIAYAVLGYPEQAQTAFRLHHNARTDPVLERNERHLDDYVLGEIALATRDYGTAERVFRDADMRPDGPSNPCSACLSLNLARVFDAAGNADSAIARYHQYLRTPSSTRPINAVLDPMYRARVHERLAQLYDERQDRRRAVEHYRTFASLWAAADPELQPRVRLARDRVRVLSEESGS